MEDGWNELKEDEVENIGSDGKIRRAKVELGCSLDDEVCAVGAGLHSHHRRLVSSSLPLHHDPASCCLLRPVRAQVLMLAARLTQLDRVFGGGSNMLVVAQKLLVDQVDPVGEGERFLNLFGGFLWPLLPDSVLHLRRVLRLRDARKGPQVSQFQEVVH